MTTDPHLDPTAITEIPEPRRGRGSRRRSALVAGVAALAIAVGGAGLALGGGGSADDPSPSDRVDPTTTTTADDLADASTTTLAAELEAQPAGTGSGGGSSSGGGGAAPTPTVGLLSLSASALDLGPDDDQGTVTLRNDGNGTAAWQIAQALPFWLELAPTSGSLAPGQAVDLVFTVDRHDLGNGTHPADIGFSADAGFVGTGQVSVSVAVEKAEIHAVVGAPGVICSLQSPGAGQKVAAIVAAGQHMAKADTLFAKIDAPNADLQKNMTYDEAHDRWITTYSSSVLGVHKLSAYAMGPDAIHGDAGNGAITVIWCP